MDKKQIIAAIGIFTFVLAGGTAYFVTISEDSISVEFNHTECGTTTFEVTKEDHIKLKCGRYIIAEWDTITSHEKIGLIDSTYIQNNRKNSKTKLYVVNSSPDYIAIVKETEYYKGGSGTDGILKEEYFFYPEGLKWNYTYNPVNKAKHFVTLRMYKYRPKYNFLFYPDDPFGNFKFSKSPNNRYGDYYYGGVSGDLVIDPLIKEIPSDATYVTEGVYFRQLNETVTKTRYVQTENGTYDNGTIIYVYAPEEYNESVYNGVNEIGFNNIKFNDADIHFKCVQDKDRVNCNSLLDLDYEFILSSNGVSFINGFNGYITNQLKEVGLI